jgi:uncharacterized protein (DUF1697 family)
MGANGAKPYVALLRGINIGGRHKLPMQALREILEAAGCEKVATYSQSGNVVFLKRADDPSVLAGAISESVKRYYGFAPKVLLLEAGRFREALANNPFDVDEGKNLHLFFLSTLPDAPDMETMEALKADSEAFKLDGRVFYFHTPEGVGHSKLAAKVEKCLGVPATGRSWNTVLKIAQMLDALGKGG